MNYLHMVEFLKIEPTVTVSLVCFQAREEFFRYYFDEQKVVPAFIILEAVFQTAGRISRLRRNNISGGSIVSIRNFNFKRPLFAGDCIHIIATVNSFNEYNACYSINIIEKDRENVVILDNGRLIIHHSDKISTGRLNNTEPYQLERLTKEFYYL